MATKCKVTGLTGTSRLRGKCSLRRSASATVQFFGETTCSPLMARSSASISACISMNLLRARSALSRERPTPSHAYPCPRSYARGLYSVFRVARSLRLLLLLYPTPRPDISVERFRKLALPEEDRRLVVIVTHLGIAGGGVRNDGKLAQRQSLRGSKSAACRFAGDRRVRLQVPAFTGVKMPARSTLFVGP